MHLNGIFVGDIVFITEQCAIVAAAVFIGWMMHVLAVRILERLKSPGLASLSFFLLYISKPLAGFFIACCVNVSLYFLLLPGHWENRAHHVLYTLIIITMGWMLMGLTFASGDWLKQRYREDNTDVLKYRSINTRLRVFTHVIIFIIWLFTVIAIIMTIPTLRTIGVSLFASAGVASIVIGMAAGPTLSNLIAGIQLALTQPIRIGDQITIGTLSGIVEEIDSTYVVVRLWDGRSLIVPLNYFIQNQFQNWTHMINESFIGMVSVYIDYTMSVEPVRAELKRIVKDFPLWDGQTCDLQVVKITDGKVVELRACVSTKYANDIFILQCQIREALLSFVQQHFIQHA